MVISTAVVVVVVVCCSFVLLLDHLYIILSILYMYPHTGSTYYVYVEQQADALARDQENMKKKAKGRR